MCETLLIGPLPAANFCTRKGAAVAAAIGLAGEPARCADDVRPGAH